MFFIEIGECLGCNRVRLSATPLADGGLEPTLLDPVMFSLRWFDISTPLSVLSNL
jgi:hypothetical protein